MLLCAWPQSCTHSRSRAGIGPYFHKDCALEVDGFPKGKLGSCSHRERAKIVHFHPLFPPGMEALGVHLARTCIERTLSNRGRKAGEEESSTWKPSLSTSSSLSVLGPCLPHSRWLLPVVRLVSPFMDRPSFPPHHSVLIFKAVVHFPPKT